MLSALLGVALTVVSVGVLLFVLLLLFNAVRAPVGRSLEYRRLTRLRARGERGDAYLQAGDLDRALREFRLAFYLEPIRSDRRLLGEVHNHHTGLLSRFIAVTEDLQAGAIRLMSLAKVDRLLNERTQLQRRCFSLREQGRADRQLREVYIKLRHNRRELESCLGQLVDEILASRPVQRYH